MTAIHVTDLVKHYGRIEALRGISFTVKEGEIFGLIGPNGAGKTTALRIVSTLLEITSGTVEVFGYNVKKDPDEVREKISYLPEEAGAYKNLSGKEYLNFMAQFYADGKDVREMVEKGISMSGLEERITDKVGTYSKGMTRKLLVARALMMEPPLAILDEPTSGLDPLIQQRFFSLIEEENRKNGATVLFSSHILSEVQKLCTKVAIIKEGRIIRVDDMETMQDTNYKKYRVALKEELKAEMFGLDGVSDFKIEDGEAAFIFSGDPNVMIRALADRRIRNLTIEEPSLEEIFVRITEGGGNE